MSFDRLQEKIDLMRNPTVVGLDPALSNIPPHILEKNIEEHGETLWAAAISAFEFNLVLINALCDIVPAVKPQMAYYEILGAEGIVVFERTCRYARSKGMYVICDGKRNDIGPTAEAYSAAYLGAVKIGKTDLRPFNADALTVNAYLGSDGIKPFVDMAVMYDKALFALVKTSNPSAGELQDMSVQPGTTVYEAVGDMLEKISRDTIGKYGYSRVGAVVGATYPDEIESLRKRLKNTFFLVPGYGAQGGAAEDVVRAFDKDGRGAIINSSRAIIAAWKQNSGTTSEYTPAAQTLEPWAAAARAQALQMRDELRDAIAGRG